MHLNSLITQTNINNLNILIMEI